MSEQLLTEILKISNQMGDMKQDLGKVLGTQESMGRGLTRMGDWMIEHDKIDKVRETDSVNRHEVAMTEIRTQKLKDAGEAGENRIKSRMKKLAFTAFCGVCGIVGGKIGGGNP